MRNTELLQQVMQYIDDHPEQHDQKIWYIKSKSCGTSGCFAGWACALSGQSVRNFHRIEAIATAALDLHPYEAGKLFHSKNTRDMLRLMVKDLINGDQLLDREHYRVEAEQ